MSDGPICVEGCGADLSKEQHKWDCPIFDMLDDDEGGG